MTLRSEWMKLTALRGTWWALATMAALTIVLSALIAAGSGCSDGCDPMELALGGVYLGQFAAVALGVLAISSEFATGMIGATFAATPSRRDVLTAKAIVVAGLVFVAGLGASALAYAAGIASLDAAAPSAADAVRAVLGTAVYLAALALLSFGVGAILRHTAGAISTVFALLWVPAIVVSLAPDLFEEVTPLSPMLAGLSIQRTVERPDSVPLSPGVGLLLCCAYAALALAAAFWLVERRDA